MKKILFTILLLINVNLIFCLCFFLAFLFLKKCVVCTLIIYVKKHAREIKKMSYGFYLVNRKIKFGGGKNGGCRIYI